MLCLGSFSQIQKTLGFASKRAMQHAMSHIRVAFFSALNKIVIEVISIRGKAPQKVAFSFKFSSVDQCFPFHKANAMDW